MAKNSINEAIAYEAEVAKPPSTPTQKAMRVTLGVGSVEYLNSLAKKTHQDVGVIFEMCVLAFQSASSEQKQAWLGEVLAKRAAF